MRFVSALCLAVVLVACVTADATVHGALGNVPPELLRDGGARLSVDGGVRVVYTRTDGSFVIPNLPVGTHIVETSLANVEFPAVRIDVSAKGDNRFRAALNDGSQKLLVNAMSAAAAAEAASASHDGDVPMVIIDAVGKHQYFVPREEFSIMSIVKNPMVIMMLFSLGMVYVMPMISDQDEMRQQMKDLQKQADTIKGGGAAKAPAPKRAVKQ